MSSYAIRRRALLRYAVGNAQLFWGSQSQENCAIDQHFNVAHLTCERVTVESKSARTRLKFTSCEYHECDITGNIMNTS